LREKLRAKNKSIDVSEISSIKDYNKNKM